MTETLSAAWCRAGKWPLLHSQIAHARGVRHAPFLQDVMSQLVDVKGRHRTHPSADIHDCEDNVTCNPLSANSWPQLRRCRRSKPLESRLLPACSPIPWVELTSASDGSQSLKRSEWSAQDTLCYLITSPSRCCTRATFATNVYISTAHCIPAIPDGRQQCLRLMQTLRRHSPGMKHGLSYDTACHQSNSIFLIRHATCPGMGVLFCSVHLSSTDAKSAK